jgi:hypothetical protein
MLRGSASAALLIISSIAQTAMAADDIGRYQAIPLQDAAASRIMILDTRDGHLWQWFEAPIVQGQPDSGGVGISYMGKVVPGGAPGELISKYRRFDPWAPSSSIKR